MSKVQCPNCFEQIDLMLDSRKNYQSRRCPQGKSARQGIGAGLNHCYCRKQAELHRWACCKCGDILILK